MTRMFTLMFSLMLLPAVRGADVEVREFQVHVDGRPAGTYTMTITKNPDGSFIQTGQANVRIRVFIKNFVYSYSGTETWAGGRLAKVESSTNDDGTRYQIRGLATDQGFEVTVNGRTSAAPANLWPMSFWQLPPPESRNGPVNLLEIDNGRLHKSQMKQVGTDKITVDGKSIETRHFQIRGGAMADLWYDASDRLVRHETVNDGHPTALHLIRIRSTPEKP